MTTVLPRLPMSMKIRAGLRAAAIGATDQVGWSAAPQRRLDDGTYVSIEPPYLVMVPLDSTTSGPPLGRYADADAEWIYQVSCYGLRGDQVEALRDLTIGYFLNRGADGRWVNDLDVAPAGAAPGIKVMARTKVEDAGIGEPVAGIIPSDLRFSLRVTPRLA